MERVQLMQSNIESQFLPQKQKEHIPFIKRLRVNFSRPVYTSRTCHIYYQLKILQ